MSSLNRRALLLGTAAAIPAALALSACGPSAVALTPAQVVADAQGIDAGLLKALPIVAAADPTLLPAAKQASTTADLTVAQTTLATMAANLPPVATGQSTLQVVEGYFNAALDTLASVTPAAALLFPDLAPAVGLVQAAAVLAPMVEAFVTPGGTTAALRAKALAPSMTVAQARALLGVRTL